MRDLYLSKNLMETNHPSMHKQVEITQFVKLGAFPSNGSLTMASKWKKGLGSRIMTLALAGRSAGSQIIGVT